MMQCHALAVEQMTESQFKRKVWYDKNVVRRKIQVDDQGLVLATSKPKKLAVQWIGQDVTGSQLSDYIIKMSNKNYKSQIYHVNLLKPYHQRPESINLLFNGKHESLEPETKLEIPYPTSNPNIYDLKKIELVPYVKGFSDANRTIAKIFMRPSKSLH
ncbi:hypothetical protein AVEN_197130-1 [Araneus ventricosus]|uniref:Uncharacterized protein n=1 Tax=Araneus ventricosus TaxID=182803 RepID=A0A4Y2E6W5_ARAVE|nr:hypothetical protein AVEN_197130-1 [Araneus ventricosus]